MTVTPTILAGLQLVIIVLLTADRWVHKVTGKASIESRVDTLEVGFVDLRRGVAEANDRVYVKLTEIQRSVAEIQLLQARQDEHFKATDNRVDALTRRVERFHGAT